MAAVDATDTNGVVNGSAEDDKNAYRPPDIDAVSSGGGLVGIYA